MSVCGCVLGEVNMVAAVLVRGVGVFSCAYDSHVLRVPNRQQTDSTRNDMLGRCGMGGGEGGA